MFNLKKIVAGGVKIDSWFFHQHSLKGGCTSGITKQKISLFKIKWVRAFGSVLKWSWDWCCCADKFIWAPKNICTLLYSISVLHICKLLFIALVLLSQYTNSAAVHKTNLLYIKENSVFPKHGLASLHSTDGSTWQGHTVDPLGDRCAKAIISK